MRILFQLLDYRFEAGMVAWAMHRLTGIALFLYLIPHVIVTGRMIAAAHLDDKAEAAAAFERIYALVSGDFVVVLEILLAGCILFHAINGLRVLLVDFTSLVRRDRLLTGLAFGLWIISFAAVAVMMALTHWG